MKPAVLILIPLLALLVIGCQENAPVSAISPATENPALVKATTSDTPFDFSAIVKNPYGGPDEMLEVHGSIQFTLEQGAMLSRDIYDLVSSIEGKINPVGSKDNTAWSSGKSVDQIDFSFQDKYVVLDKKIKVQSSKDPLWINLSLLVHRDGIQIRSVWLTTPEQSVPSKPAPLSVQMPIDFSYIVKNPYKSPNAVLEVSGKIQFELHQSPILTKDVYELTCFIEGQVYTIKPKDMLGRTAVKSSDKIEFSVQDKGVLLVKSLRVEGVKNPLMITMRIMVFRNTIQVSGVWLTVPDKGSQG